MTRFSVHFTCLLTVLLMLTGQVLASNEIVIGYLLETRKQLPALSNLDDPPNDEGIAGARLATADNNTTGKFSNQRFSIIEQSIENNANAQSALQRLRDDGAHFVLLDLTETTLATLLAQSLPTDVLLFNVADQSRRFRNRECHPQLLHTALSRDMRSDALAQFLTKKKWREWFLVTGPRAEDKAFSAAIERSAKKFRARIVARKDWSGEFDARRSAQSEVPLFTQGPEYDILIVADEIGDFGDYLLFQTWDPRPVAGTQGLEAKSWGRPVEQWGAAQLQERFLEQSNRWMLPRDYAAWLAVRSIGEAALRSKSGDYQAVNDYLRSDSFQLAAFKGRKLNFRTWNGQMRQPVALMWSRALVAQAPLEGFLHQHTELDTLGLDRTESQCQF